MESLKRNLQDLAVALDNLRSNNVALTKPSKDAMLTDFKRNQDDYFRNAVYTAIRFIERDAGNLGTVPPENIKDAEQIKALSEKLALTTDVSELKLIVEHIAELAAKIKLPKKAKIRIPFDIKADVEADLAELQKCYDSGCYRSTVVLCGRLLETALHRKYFEATGNDLLEKSPGIGLGNLIAKLKENNVELDPGLSNQIHLINQVRVHSVHQKKDLFTPSREQAHAIMLYTMDILGKLFGK
ncbi:DUF4145 domain-containing protein [Candidatus Woesearchaeota archaeon]|nr:DUF4145 domain-containing protein [Candidatus Woesearchaeota archaeon]MBW3005893.1 DUF4145 domain-containing protein [Candidatus Woesearchaeota archaeon]